MVSTRSRRGRPLPPPMFRRRRHVAPAAVVAPALPANPAPQMREPPDPLYYDENDICKRHRKRDNAPRSVRVTPYTRRRPI